MAAADRDRGQLPPSRARARGAGIGAIDGLPLTSASPDELVRPDIGLSFQERTGRFAFRPHLPTTTALTAAEIGTSGRCRTSRSSSATSARLPRVGSPEAIGEARRKKRDRDHVPAVDIVHAVLPRHPKDGRSGDEDLPGSPHRRERRDREPKIVLKSAERLRVCGPSPP